jgi:hypothetical protein
MYTILDLNGKFFASSISIDAMMGVMRGRWAGTLIDESGKVLFDIKTDRINQGVKVTAQQARDERALAWKRHAND